MTITTGPAGQPITRTSFWTRPSWSMRLAKALILLFSLHGQVKVWGMAPPADDASPKTAEIEIHNTMKEGEQEATEGSFVLTAVPDANFPDFEYTEERLARLVPRTHTGSI